MIATALIFIGGLLLISWKAFISGTYTEDKIFEFLVKLISRKKKQKSLDSRSDTRVFVWRRLNCEKQKGQKEI